SYGRAFISHVRVERRGCDAHDFASAANHEKSSLGEKAILFVFSIGQRILAHHSVCKSAKRGKPYGLGWVNFGANGFAGSATDWRDVAFDDNLDVTLSGRGWRRRRNDRTRNKDFDTAAASRTARARFIFPAGIADNPDARAQSGFERVDPFLELRLYGVG